MFIHPLKEDGELMEVDFANYAKRHFLRRFEKDYRGKQWKLTIDAIFEDLRRMRVIGSNLQKTQQVDELWHRSDRWIFKYDFKIAKTKISTKASGNRCVAFLDAIKNTVTILLIFGKGDLPKNMGEQAFIEKDTKRRICGDDLRLMLLQQKIRASSYFSVLGNQFVFHGAAVRKRK